MLPQKSHQRADVFVSGTLSPGEPYAIYRIPALCRTHSGTLLAFAEARRSIADQSSNVLVMRRLPRGSLAWGPVTEIAHDEPASLNNPCVLATKQKIWLMYQRYPFGLNERTASPDLNPLTSCQTFLTSSTDDARTWSTPRNLTALIKCPGIRSDASGPGTGIEIQHGPHAGRLIFPFNEGANGSWNVFSVFSDDQGKTWSRGLDAPKASRLEPNEVQFVEMSDGSIMLNARNQGAAHYRLTSLSHDGGVTWDTVRIEPNLPDPTCQGSILRVSFRPNIIAFSNPADQSHRTNGTLRLSHDDGKKWTIVARFPEKSFEYSCLCNFPSHKLGLLYETREIIHKTDTTAGIEGYRIRYETFDIGHNMNK